MKRKHDWKRRKNRNWKNKESKNWKKRKYKNEEERKESGTQIRHTRTAIVLTSLTKDKQDDIIRRTQTSAKLDIKDGTRHNEPTIILTGIRKGPTHDELTDGLKLENDDLNDNFGDRLKLLTVVSTRPCRNPYKENAYVRGPTDIIKYLLKTEKIYLDFQTIYINDATQLDLCFRCCRYGHVSKHCREQTATCCKCRDEHDGNEKLECLTNNFKITDDRGSLLFSADKREVLVGSEMLRVVGEGGTKFSGSVQTNLVRAEAGHELRKHDLFPNLVYVKSSSVIFPKNTILAVGPFFIIQTNTKYKGNE
ncbi:unnamed protein product [Psylliodes chrysocephalus]|uniref:CCHC-type domain-containing protein n=1 Tax=Psylliodes chrysocephalus TaxID=3402493 RepID=A0A9P0GEN9_9CUCU|nr:unnamed protein product [Psylliodes chrysocephala]